MTERYTDVLLATKRHAASCGVDISVDHTPEIEFEPYVLSYSDQTSPDRNGIILLFPPTNLSLTSDEIAFVVDRIREAEEDGKQAWLLFSEETLARVHKILKASGITNHADAITYKRNSRSFEMDWSIA